MYESSFNYSYCCRKRKNSMLAQPDTLADRALESKTDEEGKNAFARCFVILFFFFKLACEIIRNN